MSISVADDVITAQGIRKEFRMGSTTTAVLNGVDLRVTRGECVFLAGPSGSGKSTLLSILGCVLSPDAGDIWILGKNVAAFDAGDQARLRRECIGFVFQRLHLICGLTAWENVRLALDLLGRSRAAGRREAYDLLDAVGMGHKATSHVSQLSVGQRQRIAIARALAGDPELILADEPTAALDAESGRVAMQLVRDLAQQRGKTVVVVTHDSRIFPFADRILYLEDGRIASSSEGSETAACAEIGM